MPNLNKVFLIGHLTRDPEMRAVGDTTVTNFGIAVNDKWQTKDGQTKEEVFFGECQCWGKRGEAIAKYTKKGEAISIQGKLRLEQWDGKDGTKQQRTRINVEDFQFLAGKRDTDASESTRPRASKPSPKPVASGDEITEDSIPF